MLSQLKPQKHVELRRSIISIIISHLVAKINGIGYCLKLQLRKIMLLISEQHQSSYLTQQRLVLTQWLPQGKVILMGPRSQCSGPWLLITPYGGGSCLRIYTSRKKKSHLKTTWRSLESASVFQKSNCYWDIRSQVKFSKLKAKRKLFMLRSKLET